MPDGERGFTLIETVVAAAIAVVVGAAALGLVLRVADGAVRANAALRARSAADRLEDRLAADAAGAWSLFVPPSDVAGAPNGDGHELDFVTEDGSHHRRWWAYGFDAASGTVTRYAYVPGAAAVAGERFEGVDAFDAAVHGAGKLFVPGSAVYDPLFAASTASAVDFDFGFGANALGGNRLVRVRVGGAATQRTLVLASGTAPTHFTVVVRYTPAP